MASPKRITNTELYSRREVLQSAGLPLASLQNLSKRGLAHLGVVLEKLAGKQLHRTYLKPDAQAATRGSWDGSYQGGHNGC